MPPKRLRFIERRKAAGYTQESFAEALHVDRTTIGRWERGDSDPLPYIRPKLARLLRVSPRELASLLEEGAESAIVIRTADVNEGTAVHRRQFLGVSSAVAVQSMSPVPKRVIEALNIILARDADTLGVAVDSLQELVAHYTEILPSTPPAALYGDLLSVRTYADTLIGRAQATPYFGDLVGASGWLSNLLAVATSYLGDHGAALLWCADAKRQGETCGHVDLVGWATLSRATIAYYKGQPGRSSEIAQQGQQVTAAGSVVHAKLAAQEMRALAMLGDVDGMTQARSEARRAIDNLTAGSVSKGVFSIALADDPPYTATSLLHVGKFGEAAQATRGVLATAYPHSTFEQERSTNYARTQLILGLAEAGLGNVSEAVAAGYAALGAADAVWPTLVIAGKLDRTLSRSYSGIPEVSEYHERYADAVRSAGGGTVASSPVA